jgi:hypothetical protein
VSLSFGIRQRRRNHSVTIAENVLVYEVVASLLVIGWGVHLTFHIEGINKSSVLS